MGRTRRDVVDIAASFRLLQQTVRRVPDSKDYIHFQGRLWKVPQAFRGERAAIRPLSADGRYGVFFGSNEIARLDCRIGETAAQPMGFSGIRKSIE